MLKKADHTKANDGIFFIPFKNFLSVPYFRRTDVAIYKDFGSTQTMPLIQNVKSMKIRVTVPTTQVVYLTIETLNKRFKKHCDWKRFSVGIYFYKGTVYRKKNLVNKPGFLGWAHHHTTGKPDLAIQAGTYTLDLTNWNYGKGWNQMKYQLTVYQESTDKVTIAY